MSSRSACLVVLSLCGTLSGGCTDNNISLAITSFLAPDTSESSAGICEIDQSSLPISRGLIDVSLAATFQSGYSVNFAVQNELVAIANADVDTQAFYVNSFDVELELLNAADAVQGLGSLFFNYPVGSQRIDAGDLGYFSVEVLNATQVQLFSKVAKDSTAGVIAKLRPVATHAENVETGAFSELPIALCLGCLNGTEGGAALPTCPPPVSTPQAGNVCNFAADLPVTCCQCAGAALPICGEAASTAACNSTGT